MCSKLHVDENASLFQYSFRIHLQRGAHARVSVPNRHGTEENRAAHRSIAGYPLRIVRRLHLKWPT